MSSGQSVRRPMPDIVKTGGIPGPSSMNKIATPYYRQQLNNYTPVNKYTLTVELIGAVKGLLRIHDDPWHETTIPHYEQLNKQIQHVKDAIKRYEE